MSVTKRKAVISADRAHLDAVEVLVRQGRYRTVSHFVRDAVAEKLERIQRERLAEQVSRYCDAGTAGADDELVEWQALADVAPAKPKAGPRGRRATR